MNFGQMSVFIRTMEVATYSRENSETGGTLSQLG